MRLDPRQDYGFTVFNVTNVEQLPVWDRFRFEKIKCIFQNGGRILDFGDSSRALSQLLRPQMNPNTCKISVDIEPKYRSDVVADICDLPFDSGSINGIICAAILEHVYNPFRAMAEMRRILAKSGHLFVYVPWLYRYHSQWPPDGSFRDYWRFSVDGVQLLFGSFQEVEIKPIRGRLETILNLAPHLGKGSYFMRFLGPLLRRLDRATWAQASGFNVYAVK
jgi:SAM-dependent methyltransferase